MIRNNNDIAERARAIPTEMDVLCGSAGAGQDDHGIYQQHQQHLGNNLFKIFLRHFMTQYVHLRFSRVEKMAITKMVLELLSKAGVRFLQACPVYGYWYVAPLKLAKKKVSLMLREHEKMPMKESSDISRCSTLKLPCLSSFASPFTIMVPRASSPLAVAPPLKSAAPSLHVLAGDHSVRLSSNDHKIRHTCSSFSVKAETRKQVFGQTSQGSSSTTTISTTL